MTFPAGHGYTPSTSPFRDLSVGEVPEGEEKGCRVMLARYPCNWTRSEHDPELPPEDLDIFGYRRDRFKQPGVEG